MKTLVLLLGLAAACYAQSGHSVTLSWTDTQNPSGTTYNAWRATGACPATPPTTTPPAGFTQLNTTPVTAMTYLDTAVTAGDTYCYVVTAAGPNGQSVPSNTAGATVPPAFPVSGLTVVVR